MSLCYFVCAYVGNVKTQYQFSSFEPPPPRRVVSDEVEVVDECLSVVDCQRLTQSVRCLPLHDRLHITDLSLLDV